VEAGNALVTGPETERLKAIVGWRFGVGVPTCRLFGCLPRKIPDVGCGGSEAEFEGKARESPSALVVAIRVEPHHVEESVLRGVLYSFG
jgi:hypothetical protein